MYRCNSYIVQSSTVKGEEMEPDKRTIAELFEPYGSMDYCYSKI